MSCHHVAGSGFASSGKIYVQVMIDRERNLWIRSLADGMKSKTNARESTFLDKWTK